MNLKNTLIELVKEDIKGIFQDIAFPNLIVMIVFLLYKYQKSVLLEIGMLIKSVPEEIQLLFGVELDTEIGNCTFFLFYSSMFLLFWFVWRAFLITRYILEEVEKNGKFYRVCNQIYSRKEILNNLFLKMSIRFYMPYILWSLFLLLFLLLSSINQLQRETVFFTWSKMVGMGICVCTAYISGICIYYVRNKTDKYSGMLSYKSVSVPWFFANIYKLIGVVLWGINLFDKNYLLLDFMEIQMMLKNLYWISPISWCNPFTYVPNAYIIVQISISIVIVLIMVMGARHLYEKKDYFLP